MSVFWPAFILGLVVIMSGVIAFRSAGRTASDVESGLNSENPLRRGATASNVRFAAVGWMFVGSVMFIASFLDLDW
jgi:hypothetical protein